MFGLFKKLFKDPNERELAKLRPIVERINSLEPEISALSDAGLRAKTDEFRSRLAAGETLDDLLPEAFAVVREAARRSTREKFRHYDVQLMGGIVLHQGKIAEMKTGEGKTLVATLPAYLNALTGRGVHIVTVNDYLAKRDREWMGPVYEFLGLKVGLNLNGMSFEEKKKAYEADITYGTNNEFGFDYLRDNMARTPEQVVQRPLNYAIIDEVDSVLIDEARTPLIISGPSATPSRIYRKFARLVPGLVRDRDYEVDEKANTVSITEEGVKKVEEILGIDNLYDEKHIKLTHHLNQALKAHALMKKDRDYIVKDGEVKIVDEFTGRIMEGRRFSEGLHQAIEAKEGVPIQKESQTLASITFQNYFRMYDKLAGMTGTAATEENEFIEIYDLEVVVIPTNKPLQRKELPDVIYPTEMGKFKGVVREIKKRHEKGQPVLVGTVSIEKSELLSSMLSREGINHQVLNAKHHEREAEIIKHAGEKGMVTIATNMAGRGTDIVLGHGVKELGGLHILGTERHESRRIDNQLRGRSGRQGDPGSSQFHISLEDDLIRLFAPEKMMGVIDSMAQGLENEDEPVSENALLTRLVENAQKRVENRNFEIRKHVLEYDDVLNKQRQIIYQQRREILIKENIRKEVLGMFQKVLEDYLDIFLPKEVHPAEWDLAGYIHFLEKLFLKPGTVKKDEWQEKSRDEILNLAWQKAKDAYASKEAEVGELFHKVEKQLVLEVIDRKWMDHLDAMDQLRYGIGLRAYGQRDPLTEYKFESFELFQNMTSSIREEIVRSIFKVQIIEGDMEALGPREMETNRDDQNNSINYLFNKLQQAREIQNLRTNRQEEPQRKPVVKGERPGRNDPCPCGSGKKYKHCCGR